MDRKRDLVWLISFTASKCHHSKEKEAWRESFTRPSIEICVQCHMGLPPKMYRSKGQGKVTIAGSMTEWHESGGWSISL